MPPRSWFQDWREDLQASPGRVESMLRIVFASVVVLVLMMVLRVPNVAYALYVVFVVSNENPALSLRTGVASLLTVAVTLSIAFGVVILTDNDPLARVMTLAVMTFLAGMIATVTTVPALGPIWGLIYGVGIGIWENHAPADRLVKSSLWLVAAFAIGIVVPVAVSYLFSMRSPADRLAGHLRLRYRALAAMFSAYAADDATDQQRRAAAQSVSRLAAEGHRAMLELYRQIADRNLPSGSLPAAVPLQIISVAELMDTSAAFGLQAESLDMDLQLRCRAIAQQCGHLAHELRPNPEAVFKSGDSVPLTHLERVERILHSLQSMGSDGGKLAELEALPSKHVPLLIPGAASNPVNVAFALKISLCATICYLIYHAVDWPGISTSVTTVMVTGLVTSGAMKQKLAFRLLGASIGGLLGLGAEVFLFPFMDSITSLVMMVGAVAFLSAWIGAGPRFNYVGLQIAFAFYFVSLSGFSAPTELAPARDRLAGIMLALIVMWFVFDQIWPVRSVAEMRRVVASVLRDASRVVALIDRRLSGAGYARESGVLRDRLAKDLSMVRTLNEAARYEFGLDGERQIRVADKLMQMSMTTVALAWNHAVYLGEPDEGDSRSRPAPVSLRRAVEQGLSSIADTIEEKHSTDAERLVADESESEYVRLTIARYNELQSLSLSFDSID
ncbi:MAG TPA: FUSC family protein [Bryobacteraceae bacterium]|nr:FUSC family protein [Bryobacteraceae bacterium]